MKRFFRIIVCLLVSFLSLLCVFVISSSSQEIESLKKGVVKVSSITVEGKQKVGTGFIVRLEADAAYIVTASHVVEGARKVQVEFFTRRNRPVPARTIGIEGGYPQGLATLLVEDKIPSGLSVLKLTSSLPVGGGDSVTTIGFPLPTRHPAVPPRGQALAPIRFKRCLASARLTPPAWVRGPFPPSSIQP